MFAATKSQKVQLKDAGEKVPDVQRPVRDKMFYFDNYVIFKVSLKKSYSTAVGFNWRQLSRINFW